MPLVRLVVGVHLEQLVPRDFLLVRQQRTSSWSCLQKWIGGVHAEVRPADAGVKAGVLTG